MNTFMNDDFLLQTEAAKRLYHDHAEKMPIYDYHCHLNPREIAENREYSTITGLWLEGDHYKWRAMRSNGVDERFITGDAGDKEKFYQWAKTMENCIGNPLYHWTHLELRRYFGITKLLNSKNAEEIWHMCNSSLQNETFKARGLIESSNVKVICTTDDPVDSLEHHKKMAGDSTFTTKVLPAFRPDKGINIEKEGFLPWIDRLEECVDYEINSYSALLGALENRINFFHQAGCRISDHALEPPVYEEASQEELERIFRARRKGKNITRSEIRKFKTALMLFLGREYARREWAMQLHIGTIRNMNSRMYAKLGPDSGFDTIADYSYIEPLSKILDHLNMSGRLPKTIIYTLNPGDNEAVGTLIGCFQDGSVPGKIQFGSAWWFNDQKDGMLRQMSALGNLGLLSRFIGMLTDSRSFLSYTRHEYFRRILCNMIGGWISAGEVPGDYELLGKMVKNISYNNACSYFGIEL